MSSQRPLRTPARPRRLLLADLLRSTWLAIPIGGCAADTPQSALVSDGPAASAILQLTWVLIILATVVVAIVVVALVYALRRRRDFTVDAEAAGDELAVSLHHEEDDRRSLKWVLGAGLVFPVITLTALFVFTLYTLSLLAARDRPPDRVIEVTGWQYWWEVHYLDGGGRIDFETANEIHIPTGQRVQIRLKSSDVIHSFWVPRLQGKLDLIPGRTTQFWLQADSAGVYRGQCAEYCGTQHARMALLVISEPQAEFERWAARERAGAREPSDSLARTGRQVFLQRACVACHAIRGTRATGNIGPDLTHIATRRTLAAVTLPNTIGHLGGWITSPQALKQGSRMPAVPLAQGELPALLHYLASLR